MEAQDFLSASRLIEKQLSKMPHHIQGHIELDQSKQI